MGQEGPATVDRDHLIASLTAVHTDSDDAVCFDDERYIDWSTTVNHRDTGAGRMFELGNSTEAAQIDLSRAEMVQLHTALTVTLLADADDDTDGM
jgi:hypothetical protein